MKSARSRIFVAVAVVVLGCVAGVTIGSRQNVRSLVSHAAKADPDVAPARPEVQSAVRRAAPHVVPQEAVAPPDNTKPWEPLKTNGRTNSAPQKILPQPNQGGPPTKEPLKDAVARIALAWVGADLLAEAYWYAAINDPSLPPKERQDLIEDLNEDGLSDPEHPTRDDLPLIVSRILLVEEAAPYAMDEVNANAFEEAHNDLVNLANLAMGGGEPVR